MEKVGTSLHSKVHTWIEQVGFKLNSSSFLINDAVTLDHYFFMTFNFTEKVNKSSPEKAEYQCFDTYGETIKVSSLLDLQVAFFENLSILK